VGCEGGPYNRMQGLTHSTQVYSWKSQTEGRGESSCMQVIKVLIMRNLMLAAVTFRESRPAAGWLTQDG